MFVKKFLQKSNSDLKARHAGSPATPPKDDEVSSRSVQADNSSLEPRATVQLGVPASASILAFEPAQRLLALGTRDGRLKIFGRDGVEVLLKSPSSAPCKFLEFVNNAGRLFHLTTRNDIEIWDLSTRELLFYKKWEAEITGFSVIQSTSFLYVGDGTGQVSVLHYDDDLHILDEMPYSIPAQATLSGLFDSENSCVPSVVSILPQSEAVYGRVVIVYGNGLIILWGLHEAQVIAVRGGTEVQQRKLGADDFAGAAGDEDEEEKEICCACWACHSGTVLAVGYTDGDIWLWSIPANTKVRPDKLDMLRTPIVKLRLSSSDNRMPVIVLRWSSSSGVGKPEKGPSGYLYVFGGQEIGLPEVVTVISVNRPASQLQLRLPGAFADVLLLPNSATARGPVLVLSTPGFLDVYEETDVLKSLSSPNDGSLPRPIAFKLALTAATVTKAKLVVLQEDSIVASHILKIPRLLRSYIPPALPSGTRWPVSGGSLTSSTIDRKSQPSLYITGHENGRVHVWDASTPSLYFLATAEHKEPGYGSGSPVTAIEFCCKTGTLATGNEAGLVSVYLLNPEERKGPTHFVTRNEAPTSSDVEHAPGFQCFAILSLHDAAIRCIAIANHISCIIIGDDRGMMSLFDLQSCTLRFHGICFENASPILSFAALDVTPAEESGSTSSSPQSSSSVVFVLSKDADIAAVDGSSGRIISTCRPHNASVALSFYLMDPSGFPLRSLARKPADKLTKQAVFMQAVEHDESGDIIVPQPGIQELEEDVPEDDDVTSAEGLLLLCAADSLRLYAVSTILQRSNSTVRKVKLSTPCAYAGTFYSKEGNESFLLLLFPTGEIQIRSLPELDIVKGSTMGECLGREFQDSPTFFNTVSVFSTGRLAAVDDNREVVFLSLFKDENDLRLPASYPSLYDKDIAAATEAALNASFHVTAKKKQSQFQDLIGGVMKEIKQTLGAGHSSERTAQELPKLFARQLFSAIGVNKARIPQTPRSVNQQGSASSSPRMESSTAEETSADLDIDDIDLDDEEITSSSPSGSTTKKPGMMKKLKNSFKGKKKASRSPTPTEDEERNALFEGGSTDSQTRKPGMRTAEEIKAAYGHKKVGEASGAAAQARDRLMERQERLQNIGKRAEEMQEGAENFASLAKELASKMEARKWYEI